MLLLEPEATPFPPSPKPIAAASERRVFRIFSALSSLSPDVVIVPSLAPDPGVAPPALGTSLSGHHSCHVSVSRQRVAEG